MTPPDVLFHGTVVRSLDSILAGGLSRRRRRHVHLSETADEARQVGGRRGVPVVLEVRAGEMASAGFVFHRSASGIWLTGRVPARYIRSLG